MSRPVVTVEPRRAPAKYGGHRLYPLGAASDCPQPGHKFCAYDGTEADRCPQCHVSISRGCEHNCKECFDCGETFGSIPAYEAHRTGEGGKGKRRSCLDPESAGLRVIERGEWLLWEVASASR